MEERHVGPRGDDGVARIKELTKGVGADSVIGCVGTLSGRRSWKAVRPHIAVTRGRGRLSRDGRTARDQDAAASGRKLTQIQQGRTMETVVVVIGAGQIGQESPAASESASR